MMTRWRTLIRVVVYSALALICALVLSVYLFFYFFFATDPELKFVNLSEDIVRVTVRQGYGIGFQADLESKETVRFRQNSDFGFAIWTSRPDIHNSVCKSGLRVTPIPGKYYESPECCDLKEASCAFSGVVHSERWKSFYYTTDYEIVEKSFILFRLLDHLDNN